MDPQAGLLGVVEIPTFRFNLQFIANAFSLLIHRRQD